MRAVMVIIHDVGDLSYLFYTQIMIMKNEKHLICHKNHFRVVKCRNFIIKRLTK
jgi:hypothetical protein